MPLTHASFSHSIADQLTVEQLANNPYPLFQQMLATAPVCWAPAFKLWTVTRRADVIAILRDAETYTMEPADAQVNPMEDIFGPMMLSIDGPEHKAIRDVFAEPFRARLVEDRYQALIATLTATLIDQLPSGATIDLDKAFADQLAIYTIVAALGLDIDNVAQLREWYDDFAVALGNTANDPALRQRGKGTFARFHTLITAQIAQVRQTPNDSVLSHIVHNNLRNLSHEQIVSNIALTFFGGVETASALLSNTIWALLRHPEQCAEVRQRPKLMAAAIAESLRWESPVQSAMRFPTRDVTLHDIPIKAGAKIYCMLGAANRDPAFFPDPDRFDIQRPNADKHLSFAYGPHYCFGAPLALLEGEIGLTMLLERLPELQLHPDHLTAPCGHEFRATPTLICTIGKKR